MMTIVDAAIRFAIAMLLASLWQAPLFALAAWLVLRVRPNANATTRHSVLAAALLASLVLPVTTATLAMQHGPSSPNETSDIAIPRSAVPYRPAKTSPSIPTTTRIPSNGAGSTLAAPAIERANVSVPRWIALAVVAVWLAGAAFVSLRLIASLLHLERLKRDALPLSIDYREGLSRWTAATKGTRNVRLCTSDEIDIPIAVGLFDAMILVPKHLLDELQPAEIDSIVLHELAHLRRSDDWFNAAERFAHALWFFNPAILWLAGQLDLEREVACDDWVLQQNDALPYATCLAKVAETAIWPRRPMTAPGAFVTRRGMSIRIERLLAKHRDVRIRTSFGPAGSTIAVLAVLGIVTAFVSPSIAYSVTAAQSHVALAPASATTSRPNVLEPHPIRRSVRLAETSPHVDVRPAIVTVPHVSVLPAQVVASRALPLPRPHAHGLVHSARSVDAISDAVADAGSAAASAGADGAAAAVASGSAATASDRAESFVSVPNVPSMSGIADIVRNATRNATRIAARTTANGLSLSHTQIVAEADAPDYIDALARVGYTHLTVDQLVSLKSVGVDADFIRELQRNGLAHPSVDDLIRMRTTGVDPKFIGTMRARYGDSLSIDELTGMRAVGVDADYFAAMRKQFGPSLGIDRLAGMRAVGVTPDYVAALRAAGLHDLTPDRVQALQALDVTPGYVRELTRAGYPDLTTDQAQQLRALGIDGAFVGRANAHGFHDLSVDQLIHLKVTGVL